MRDIKPLLLVLLSIGLVGTWIFHIYDKTQYSRMMVLSSQDSISIANAVRDSLSQHYTGTISDLDQRLNAAIINSDTLQSRLAMRLKEISALRAEIVAILGRKNVSRSEVIEANEKMLVLQQKVSELNTENETLELQQEEFGLAMQQLSRNTDSLQQKLRVLSLENENLSKKVNMGGIFVVTELKLSAVDMRSSKDLETTQLKKADKFVVSFNIQNNSTDYTNAEIAIVIIQPNSRVLQDTKWESGSFSSINEGTKDYTRLVKFDYTRGEKREMSFSLDTEEFEKGNYVLQVWHKGVLIGQASMGLI